MIINGGNLLDRIFTLVLYNSWIKKCISDKEQLEAEVCKQKKEITELETKIIELETKANKVNEI